MALNVSLVGARHNWPQGRGAPHDCGTHVMHTGAPHPSLLVRLCSNFTSRHPLIHGARSVREPCSSVLRPADTGRHRRHTVHQGRGSEHVDPRSGSPRPPPMRSGSMAAESMYPRELLADLLRHPARGPCEAVHDSTNACTARLAHYPCCRSRHVSGMASTHSAAITQNPCAPMRA